MRCLTCILAEDWLELPAEPNVAAGGAWNFRVKGQRCHMSPWVVTQPAWPAGFREAEGESSSPHVRETGVENRPV